MDIYYVSLIFLNTFTKVRMWPCLLTDRDEMSNLGQINRNLVGSNYTRSPIKSAHFGPIRYQTWRPLAMHGFRGEDLLEINQSEQELPVVAMFVNGSGLN
jgi:hypothetical protein